MKEIKKILVFSVGGLDTMTESFVSAFRFLGFQTEVFFQDNLKLKELYLFKFFCRARFAHLALQYWDRYKAANSPQYEEKIKSFKPDFIFMLNFNSVSSKLLKKIRNEYKIPTGYIVMADPLILDKYHAYFLNHLLDCSHLFFINKTAIPSLRLLSNAKMIALPLSADEKFFYPLNLKKDLDLVMMGNFSAISVATTTKAFILDRLCGAGFNVSAAGVGLDELVENNQKEFPHLNKLNIIHSGYLSTEEVNILYNRAKIVLAPEHPRDKDSPSPRLFDASLAGSFSLADYQTDTEELFDGVAKTFRSINELIDLVKYYLNNEEEREMTAQKMRQITLVKHNYLARAKKILSEIFTD